ncbi:myb/SANT-like domain-containing protein [Artemisia annua]|uniref:Myb/SANT-like domain-containing protein n=1 Tax=Artemisia annua TaxID=35608 RepID=A0A2U1P2X7_ARTAN|nr:myb/SANT-like domain-containing protein [Artemisia annua]
MQQATMLKKDGTTAKQLVWTHQMDDAFIEAMLKEKENGNKLDGSFTSHAYANIVEELSKSLKLEIKKVHLQNRLKTLKAHFSQYNDIFRGVSLSGFSWDPITKLMNAEDEVWEALIKENPEAAKLRTKPIRHYNEMLELFAKDRATGEGSLTAKERNNRMKQNEQTTETVDELDETDQLFENNDIGSENFNNYDDVHVTSEVKAPSKITPKSKKRKLEEEDVFISKITSSLDNISSAIDRSTKVPTPKESNEVSRYSRSTRSISGTGKSALKQVNVLSKTGLGSMKKSARKGNSKKKQLLKDMDGIEYEVEENEEMDARDEEVEVNEANTNGDVDVCAGIDKDSGDNNQGKSMVNETSTNVHVNGNNVENVASNSNGTNVHVNCNNVENVASSSNGINVVGEIPVPFEDNPVLNPGNGKVTSQSGGRGETNEKRSNGDAVGEVTGINGGTNLVWPSLKETLQADTVMLDQNGKKPMSFVNAFQGISGYG